MLDAGWGPHGAGDGRPERVPGCEQPQEPGAGLHLKAAVIVMLEFRADGQPQLLGKEPDLILHKGAEELIGATAGRKDNGRDASDIARRHAIPEPQPDLLLPGDTEAVLHVDIERITRFTERRLTPVRAIVVELRAES